jgi:hypothetical protein
MLTDLLKLCVLRPAEERFTIERRAFIIKAGTAGAVAQYRDMQFSKARMEGGEIKAMEGLNESDLFLLSLCLFEEYNDNGQTKLRAVPLVELRTWPNNVTTPLIDWVKDHSHLAGEEDKDTLLAQRNSIDAKLATLTASTNGEGVAKNLHAATTGPSA